MPEPRDTTAEHANIAAQIEADVGVEHIADVYAKALLNAAERDGQTAAVVEEFDAVVTEVLNQFPKLEEALGSVLIRPNEKESLLEKIFGGRVSPLLVNFLKVVARHGRLDCLRAVHHQTHVLYDQMRQYIPVQLTTAVPVDPAVARQFVDVLRKKLDGEPVIVQKTDPSLIGGAVVRLGDVVYDGSIANQLKNLRQQIGDRSAHEIQSRRNRFRH